MTEEQYNEQEAQYEEQRRANEQESYHAECEEREHEKQSLDKNSYVVHLLNQSLSALKWMHSNMAVIDQNLQSDAFNIPANAITQLEEYLTVWSEVYNEKTIADPNPSYIDNNELPF